MVGVMESQKNGWNADIHNADVTLPHLVKIDKACAHLRTLCQDLLNQKLSKPVEIDDEGDDVPIDTRPAEYLDPQRMADIATTLTILKTLHRTTHLHTRSQKQLTLEAKLAMDRNNLGLQNLQYERENLEREIRVCSEYESVYGDIELSQEGIDSEDIDMIEEDEHDREHRRMIQRLTREKQQREQLLEEQTVLQNRKQELIRENKKIKTELDKLDEKLETFVNAATEVETWLNRAHGVDKSEQKEENELEEQTRGEAHARGEKDRRRGAERDAMDQD